jgi:hypothetical protein
MAIVYRHRRLDNNQIFYIGIGKNKLRAYSKKYRNKYWINIVNKIDYSVEILYENIEYNEAKELEIFLISLYGRKDIGTGILCNLTDGGEGTLGIIRIVSDKTKQKQKERMLGNQHLLGHKHSEETKKKISESNKGRKMSEKNKEILRSISKGRKPWTYGKNHSKQTIDRMTNRDTLLDNKDIKIFLDIDNGIFYSVKDLTKLLNLTKGQINCNRKIFNNLKYILTNN